MIEADDLRQLIHMARPQMKAMILLALNAGLGNTDVSELSRSSADLRHGWLDYPRLKTGVGRTCPLWPETVSAIRAALADRPAARNAVDERLIFLTRCGQPWVRVTPRDDGAAIVADSVSLEFSKLLKLAVLSRRGLGFYALQHIFRTVADRCKDQPAIDHIMGHSDGSMDEDYRERIDADRLVAVTNTVRSWLWPAADSAR